MRTAKDIVREEFTQAQPFWRDAVTQAQAMLMGTDDPLWPPPCPKCGALFRRTPKGRWFVDHLPEGHSEARMERVPDRDQ